MICGFCKKEIPVVLGEIGSSTIGTKYWRVKDGQITMYFCDARCSLDMHNVDKMTASLLGEKDD